MNLAPDTGRPAGRPDRSDRRASWAVLRRPGVAAAVAFLLIVALAVILAPVLSPYSPLAQDLTGTLQLPSARHLLGTDTLGRDVLSRLLYGGRPALWGALEATLVFAFVGIVFGLIAGYSRGAADRAISAAVDIMGSLPSIVVVFTVLAMFDNSLSAAMISAGFFGSYGLIRIVRASTKETREELYVAAARVSGLGPVRILGRHILPRLINPILVQLTIFFGVALVLQSGLGFLNLGVAAPAPSWGGMVGEGASVIQQFPWLLVPPGVAIALTVLATVVLGDALQEITAAGRSRQPSGGRMRTSVTRAEVAETAESPRGSASSLLTVGHLTVSLEGGGGRKEVVRDISFSVKRGELVGLVGESGSGKTITALSLMGLLPAGSRVTATTLEFDGRDLLQAGSKGFRDLRGTGIGLVSQEPMVALDPSFSVGYQLGEVFKATGRHRGRDVRRLVIDALADVRLKEPEAVAKKYPFQLSGGMAQRVGIAMALAGQPSLLVADEPTTALDVTVQAEILDLLRALRQEHGMAVLLVTHNLGVVADFCERVLVMRKSELIEDRGVLDLFDRPENEYTRALLRATPSLVDLGAARRSGAALKEKEGGFSA